MLYILGDIYIHQEQAAALFCDSRSALCIVENPVFHNKTNHIRDIFLAEVLKTFGNFFSASISRHFHQTISNSSFQTIIESAWYIQSLWSINLWEDVEKDKEA